MYALLLHFFGHVAQFFELNSVGWGGWGYIYNREITAKRNKWRGKTDKGKKDAAKPKVASFPRADYRLVCQAIKQIIKQQLKRERE